VSASRKGQRAKPLSERQAEAPCVTRFELASLLHVSLRTVDRMIADEEINVHRVRGKAVRFLRSDVEEYLKATAESACRTGL
jgi:excisionase family DNA binding protein